MKFMYYMIAASIFFANIFVSIASAEITFVSATNAAQLTDTVDDNGQKVFIIGGIADGESTQITFSTDGDCPGVAMTGGAEFDSAWSCGGSQITANLTNRGGLSFGPSNGDSPSTFYVTFNDPPTPPGATEPPTEIFGTQISVFGDVSHWSLTGEAAAGGLRLGAEISGSKGSDAHLRIDFPQSAVTYFGGIMGVFVGGKLDPFSAVTVNEDGSASIAFNIEKLGASSVGTRAKASDTTVTKTITAGERSLGIAFNKTSVKTGKSVSIALCAGADFTAGDKLPVAFTVGGKAVGIKKSFVLDESGCAQGSVKLKSIPEGKLTGQIKYKGAKAKATLTVTK